VKKGGKTVSRIEERYSGYWFQLLRGHSMNLLKYRAITYPATLVTLLLLTALAAACGTDFTADTEISQR